MSTPSFPKLEQFLGAYFHQDWTFEADTSAQIVEAYRKQADTRAVSGILEELGRLRSERLPEEKLRQRIEALGACIDPSAENMTCDEWLATLESGLRPSPAASQRGKPQRPR